MLERTSVLCVDTVGSPNLVLAEAEGTLQMRSYDEELNTLVFSCAETLGINNGKLEAAVGNYGRCWARTNDLRLVETDRP